jgi:PAS domain S-box-containing protein
VAQTPAADELDNTPEPDEWQRVALASIADAVISTDADGRVTFMNAAAATLTGWAATEALGRPLSETLRLIDEQTRQPVADPALRALREGARVGLSPGTLLVSRDGHERPIDDSAAPIRGADGQVIGAIIVFRDITERRKAERALAESRAAADRQRRLYQAILGNTPDLAYVFDLQYRFIYANDGLLRMWGRTWSESIGRTCLELGYEPWHAEMHAREIDQVAATRQPVRGEVPFHGTFGRRIYEYIFVPVLNDEGEVEAVAGTTRDVTDRQTQMAEREAVIARERAARAAAERASHEKEEFLAMLSHELRTPLNAILGWTQVLRNRPAAAASTEQGLAVIDRNARMQAQLIDDLLDMSRIMSGKMRLDSERVDPRLIIESAIDAVRGGAEAKQLTIDTRLEAGGACVVGDPLRLQQVVWNLLTNAVKFSPRGSRVQVTLGLEDGQVRFAVGDSGQGIAPAFLPHVFDAFRQADASTTREHGGLGIGLAIVRQLVELHGGTVEAQSEGEGHGAVFVVRLPVAVAAPMAGAGERFARNPDHDAPAHDLPSLQGVTVLVVDDEVDARELVERILHECGARVVLAGTAAEGLALVLSEHPDVILSDIGMPQQDGYAFMRAARQRGVRVPAAALTAFARSEDRTRALHAGYQTHVAKPFDAEELAATVAALAHKTGSHNGAAHH